jgi:hypothetical protein
MQTDLIESMNEKFPNAIRKRWEVTLKANTAENIMVEESARRWMCDLGDEGSKFAFFSVPSAVSMIEKHRKMLKINQLNGIFLILQKHNECDDMATMRFLCIKFQFTVDETIARASGEEKSWASLSLLKSGMNMSRDEQ